MEDYDPKEFLLFALQHFQIDVSHQEGKWVHLAQNYTIEIEGKKRFKLLHRDQVIAPFQDLEELCHFIKMDMQLNEED